MGIFDTTMPDANTMAGAPQANVAQVLATTRQVQAQTANLEAAKAGIIADSATKTRNLAAQQWIGLHMGDMADTTGTAPLVGGSGNNPNAPAGQASPDGSAPAGGAGNGSQPVNYSKLYRMASDAGYGDFGPKIIENMQDAIKKSIDNAKSQQELNMAQFNGGVTAAGVLAQQVDKAAPEDKMAVYNFGKAQQLKQFGPGVINERTMPDITDPKNLASWVAGTQNATMTPKDNADRAINQENANTARMNAEQTVRSTNMSADQANVAAALELNKAGPYDKASKLAASMPAPTLPTGWGQMAEGRAT